MGTLLLSPEGIHKVQKLEENATRERVNALAKEESDIVFKLNLARQEDFEERERMTKEHDEFKAKVKAEVEYSLAEIKGLEDRKAEAMKPVDELFLDAQNRVKAVKIEADKVEKRELAVSLAEIALTVRETNVAKRESDVEVLRQSFAPQEAQIIEDNQKNVESANKLERAWATFHVAVAEQDRHIAEKESKIKIDSLANENERKILEARKVTQDNKDIEITDRYAQLEKTTLEINQKSP